MGPSSPYFLFGAQRRYAYAWHGGAGGVPQSRVAAESRGLGMDVFGESGLNPYTIPSPAFKQTHHHNPTVVFPPASMKASLSDWPAARSAGPEPLDPHEGSRAAPIAIGLSWDGLSDNEKRLVYAAGVGAAAFLLWKRSRRRARR